MRTSSRLVLSVIFLALLTTAALAQKRMCPKPPPSPFHHDGQIVTSFDGRAGGMRTTLQHPRALVAGSETFYLAASFTYQRVSTPTLDLILYEDASGSHSAKAAASLASLRAGQPFVLLLDGQPRDFNRNVSYRSQQSGGRTLDAAQVTLTYADAAAITRARSVVAKVGGVEIALTNNHLEALREMVSLMAPSPDRWQTADTSVIK